VTPLLPSAPLLVIIEPFVMVTSDISDSNYIQWGKSNGRDYILNPSSYKSEG
jgi:hypothetical protein